jgi:HEPN domain-containing protein
MSEETNAWMRQAKHELTFARQALASGANDIACYLGQQALEKFLKGLIILAGQDAPRIHNLDASGNFHWRPFWRRDSIGDIVSGFGGF